MPVSKTTLKIPDFLPGKLETTTDEYYTLCKNAGQTKLFAAAILSALLLNKQLVSQYKHVIIYIMGDV